MIEVQFYLQHSRPLHQFLIGPRMMDLHWSWESSPSPRGFTIKCFIQWRIKKKWLFLSNLFQHSHPGWFSGSARSLVLTQQQRCNSHTVRSLLHNHQIHWKLILTSCDCCNFAIVIVIVAILRSEQKSKEGVAFAVQWVARSWLPGRCKFPHRFHIGAHTLKKLRIKQN